MSNQSNRYDYKKIISDEKISVEIDKTFINLN